MANIVLKDRVKVTATTTGTGTITLGAAAAGFQDFSVIGNGGITYYTIALQSGNEWEVGFGTVTQVTGTWFLARTTVYESSNANNLVNFSAGTKDVFVTYPAERAIYEEPDGQTLIDGGPITILGSGVTVNPSLEAELGKFVSNVNSFGQVYNLNQNDGDTASADFVAYNDLTTDGFTYFTDMGISSSGYTSVDYPLFTPNSGYVFHEGDDFFLGNQTTGKDVVLFAGGVDTVNEAVRIKGADQSVELASDLSVAGTATITGAAEFQSTVLLDADPTLALQAATKQYVDQQVTAGLHIHEPVRVETTGNLTATYVHGGTTFNITTITSGTTVTTSANHGLSVNDQIWLYSTAGNGLSTNTAYFVFSVPAANQLTLSLAFGGAQITGLTNASGLTYATRANSGVGATLTNAGTQVALNVDGIALTTADRVMVRLQTNGAENGVYTVTTVGNGSTNWVLTRATDANMVNPSNPDGLGTGDYFFTREGVINAGDSHVLTTEPNTMIIGYTTLTYTQFSGSVDYTGGTNISIVGQTISVSGTIAATLGGTGTSTVTTGDLLYGSGTDTWSKLPAGAGYKSLVMNAGGTNVEWNAVPLNQSAAISGTLPAGNGGTGLTTYTLGDLVYSSATNTLAKLAGSTTTTKAFLTQTGTGSASAAPAWGTIAAADVSGLAPSATTDTTDATNITSGTLPVARLNGSYTGITGVGTLAAGTWNGSVIDAAYGGTGQSSYTTGDLLYASGATTLSKLADVVTGNALISGGVGTAPAWGKIGLTTHVSGTLPLGSGGTNATDAAGARTSLGGTTVGSNVFTLANPSAITFPRFNADNTVSALDAASFRTAIGAGTGSGTVTSVTGTAPVVSSGGNTPAISMAAASSGVDGYMTGTYATKLDGIAAGATNVTNTNQLTNGAGFITSAGTAANVSGVVAVANGGTGLTSFTANGIPYANTTTTLTTGSALGFNGTDLLNTGAYTAPNNGAGAGQVVRIRGATGTGQANATGGNGFIQLLGAGGTNTWTNFSVGVATRRRGGISLQAGTSQADAGGTFVNGSAIEIAGSSGTNNGTSAGQGSTISLVSGSSTKIDTLINAGATVSITGANASGAGSFSTFGGSFSANATTNIGGGSASMGGGNVSSGGSANISSGGYSGSVFSNSGAAIALTGGSATATGGITLTVNNPGSGTRGRVVIDNCTVGSGRNSGNAILGVDALLSTTTGIENVAIGQQASRNLTTGGANIAIGNNTLLAGIDSEKNIAIGPYALTSLSAGYRNIAIGYDTARTTASGFENISIGVAAHYSLSSSYNSSVAIGTRALYNGGGSSNTAVGHEAGYDLSSGFENVFLGRGSGQNAATNVYCVYIGVRTASSSSDRNQEVVVAGTDSALNGKGSNTFFAYANSGGGVGGAYYNGANTTTWSTISDERIKTNFVPVTNGLEVVTALEPTEFNYILGGKHEVGFRAQQYMTVLPEQVSKNAASPEEKKLVGEDEIYGITRNLDPYFVSAIKTLAAQVEQLKAEINTLKGIPNA